jgi:hypothetical protein
MNRQISNGTLLGAAGERGPRAADGADPAVKLREELPVLGDGHNVKRGADGADGTLELP